MDEGEGARERIVTGPRHEALVAALDDAVAALEAAVDDEALAAVWTRELREDVLEAVHARRDALERGEALDAGLEGLPALEAVDALVGDERLEAIVAADFCAEDLDRAARCLAESRSLRDLLASTPSDDDRSSGLDERVAADLLDALDAVIRRLAAGEYLERDDVRGWFGTLAAHGVVRRPVGAALSSASLGAVGGGDVDAYPPGRRWERVVLYDRFLVDVVRTDLDDVLAEVSEPRG